MSSQAPKTFRFIDLPREIRDLIYKSLLGDREIEVHQCHSVYSDARLEGCKHPHNGHPYIKSIHPIFTDANNDIIIPSFDPSQVANSPNRYCCGDSRSLISDFSTNILQVNRQLHDEAAHFLFTANVFSFCATSTFRAFAAKLTTQQLSLFKSIRLVDYRCWFDDVCYKEDHLMKAFTHGIVRCSLHSLTTIHLDITLCCYDTTSVDLRLAKDDMLQGLEHINWMVRKIGLKIKAIPMSFRMPKPSGEKESNDMDQDKDEWDWVGEGNEQISDAAAPGD